MSAVLNGELDHFEKDAWGVAAKDGELLIVIP